MAREPFATRLTSMWIGGIFFWIIRGFKGTLTEQLSQEYESRNITIGNIITFVAFAGIVWWFVS